MSCSRIRQRVQRRERLLMTSAFFNYPTEVYKIHLMIHYVFTQTSNMRIYVLYVGKCAKSFGLFWGYNHNTRLRCMR